MMNYFNLLEARKIYVTGKNVTTFLKTKNKKKENISKIIEIVYDLQAGSYIRNFNNDYKKIELYTSEMSKILNEHILKKDTLLDVGSGELTTLTSILNKVNVVPKNIFAFDISWSRLIKGKKFFKKHIRHKNLKLSIFVADMMQIPLHTSCVDVVISSHALEPNGKNLQDLIKELFRVVKRKLILFEPSYEINSIKGQKRMDKFEYIKGIKSVVEKLGGCVTNIIPIKNYINKLNPTVCYIIEPPKKKSDYIKNKPIFCVPGTDFILQDKKGFKDSKDLGIVFPVLKEIPILKSNYGILASAKFKI